ncbi:MAG: glycosyltransferase family 4 protein [Solirubrobacteraceae bacterium]
MPRLLAINAVSGLGGAEIGLLRLIERLPDWQVTLTAPNSGPLMDEARRRGAAVESLALGGLAPGGGARALGSWARARRLSRRHDVTYLNGTVAGRLLPAVKTKTVLHVHDLVTRVPSHWQRATTILADSEAVADRLHPLAAHVVHCPVALDTARAPAPPWPTDDPRPVVGYVGRIEPRKGVLDLVRAAPAIDARVVLVGDDTFGGDEEYGRLVAASTDVEHCGWIDDAAAIMGHLDVLVLPSYAEPFGTVLAEAMAAGTPVVATAVGGLPEVVGDAGLLVPPGRPDALARAVNEVLARRDELGPHAVARARSYDADSYARRVESLIAP